MVVKSVWYAAPGVSAVLPAFAEPPPVGSIFKLWTQEVHEGTKPTSSTSASSRRRPPLQRWRPALQFSIPRPIKQRKSSELSFSRLLVFRCSRGNILVPGSFYCPPYVKRTGISAGIGAPLLASSCGPRLGAHRGSWATRRENGLQRK